MPHMGTVSPTTIIIIIGQEMHGEPESEANSPILQQELYPKPHHQHIQRF